MHNNETGKASMYLFHSPRKEASWIQAPATDRATIAASGKAEFITALDVDLVGDDPAAWRYIGAYYLDFDAEEIEDTISQFQKFLRNLQGLGINLDQVSLFASGKKGFHIEIPQAMFLTDPKPMPCLPAIYKEMAFSMYVDSLDLAVYTAKKGRMWRTPNFKRPGTGTFKVQLTADEALSMTPERYRELVSAPRPLWTPEPPTFNNALAMAFTLARDKVSKAAKRKPTQDRKSLALKERCTKSGYPLPPSLLGIASGRVPARDGIGFNKIALQMGIASCALGINADDLVTLCSGLIETHASDSHRYQSRGSRINELHKAWRYAHENPAYTFSVGAVRAILPENARTPDLRGL